MVLQLLARKFEVEATDENLALRVGKLHGVLRVATTHIVFLHDLAVGVRLLDLLPIVSHHEVVGLMATSLMVLIVAALSTTTSTAVATSLTAALVIVRRLHIHTLIHDVVPLRLVRRNDAAFGLHRLILIVEAEEDEAKATTSLR